MAVSGKRRRAHLHPEFAMNLRSEALFFRNTWINDRKWAKITKFVENAVCHYRVNMLNTISDEWEDDSVVQFSILQMVKAFLTQQHVPVKRIELLLVATLQLACKFWNTCPHSVDDMIASLDAVYTRKCFLDMEREILKAVDFQIPRPPPLVV